MTSPAMDEDRSKINLLIFMIGKFSFAILIRLIDLYHFPTPRFIKKNTFEQNKLQHKILDACVRILKQ
jgi:hypothetical protein